MLLILIQLLFSYDLRTNDDDFFLSLKMILSGRSLRAISRSLNVKVDTVSK
ncbi:MAG: hypothetical protein LBM96_07535 [Methanobrevibacter sp.]|nr:hypothetical protein [Candidatus Methanoflexus mossambicus]